MKTSLKGVLLIGFAAQALASCNLATETEEVTLRNGRTYKVATEKGMPVPFKSRKIEVTGLGPAFSSEGKMEWYLHAKLHEKGAFTVTATTPLDAAASTSFECVGPGQITQPLFRNDKYPKLWEWYQEPETSWVPMVFSFKNKDSGGEFQVTQWTKFGPSVKVQVRRALKQLP